MTADKIFYTDEQHHIMVTDSTFVVKDKAYNIFAIRDHIIREKKPIPFLGLLVATIGSILALAGMFQFGSFEFIPQVTVWSRTISAYWWVVLAGAILLFAGLLMIVMVRPQYALHISTAEGEDDVIVSPKREYVKQIIDALNRAFMLRAK
jgi:hypothetical protein